MSSYVANRCNPAECNFQICVYAHIQIRRCACNHAHSMRPWVMSICTNIEKHVKQTLSVDTHHHKLNHGLKKQQKTKQNKTRPFRRSSMAMLNKMGN